MRDSLRRAAVSGVLLLTLIAGFSTPSHSFQQRSQPALVCRKSALAALKPIPKLSYPCGSDQTEWDEKALKLPARVSAIKTFISELSSFSDPSWWATSVQDLNVCDFTQAPGALTSDQRQAFADGDYSSWLFGNDHIRLALIPDPCYQTEYGGSNAFLLHRNLDHVFVTQVLDGYFSRADNSVNIAFAKLNTQEIIEISTGTGGLNPTLTNYYFAVDPHSHMAVPKNLFNGDHGPTNQTSSAMLFNDTVEPLQVLRAHSLTQSFVIYVDDAKGKIDDNGRSLSRKVLRWNGKLYR